MNWIKTSNFLPLYVNYPPPFEGLQSLKDYLILIPRGWGWDKKIVKGIYNLNEDGKTYLHYWKDQDGNAYDTDLPLYWCQIDLPEGAAEVLSDWQDEMFDRNFDQK